MNFLQVPLVHDVRRYRLFHYGVCLILRHHEGFMTELPQQAPSNPLRAFNKFRIRRKPRFTSAGPLSPEFSILNLNEWLQVIGHRQILCSDRHAVVASEGLEVQTQAPAGSIL